ncbi:hypothetical protein [Nocardioides sp. SYSU DS0663]|uniref:hypothetical protein n=1 Tax=Nocardioides sp. SYSU DS0663 TaxID=3416445 RepID=UPI003F4BE4A4
MAGLVAGVAAGVVVGGVGGGVGGAAAAGSGGASAATYEPHPSTIVEITGDKLHGFEIYRYDGTEQFPPVDSEARAECRGYDTQVLRVRCRTEVRTWYRDLGEMKRAINYAQSTAGS